MAYIRLAEADRAAKEHLRAVFRTHYATYLAAERLTSTLTPKPQLVAPEADSIYLTDMDNPDALARNERSFVYIYDDSTRVIERTNSGGNTSLTKQTTLDLKVIVVHAYSLEDKLLDPSGVEPQPDEITAHKNALYGGAVIDMLYTHGRSPTAIHELEMIDTQQIPLYQGELPILGVCAQTWRITQMVSVPQSVC